ISSDIERSKRFYTEVLGAESRDRPGGPHRGGPVAVRLAGTTIDFFEPNDRQQPAPGGPDQHHAYIVKFEDFDTWIERLSAFGIPLTYGSFGTRMSMLFDDP